VITGNHYQRQLWGLSSLYKSIDGHCCIAAKNQ